MAEPARWAGPKTRIVGEVTAGEDLLVEGEIDGKVTIPAHRLLVAATAKLKADVFARVIRIAGTATGTFTASDKVDIEATACVEGRIVAPRVVLAEGARFNGRVEPHKTDAAVRVAQYRMAQDDHQARPS